MRQVHPVVVPRLPAEPVRGAGGGGGRGARLALPAVPGRLQLQQLPQGAWGVAHADSLMRGMHAISSCDCSPSGHCAVELGGGHREAPSPTGLDQVAPRIFDT